MRHIIMITGGQRSGKSRYAESLARRRERTPADARIMGVRPLLSLGLRFGEGTGALCAYPIVESSVRMINEMSNFDNANITKYF